MHGFF
jgi:hypothetical protein